MDSLWDQHSGRTEIFWVFSIQSAWRPSCMFSGRRGDEGSPGTRLKSPHQIRHKMAGVIRLPGSADDEVVKIPGEGEVKIVGKGIGELDLVAFDVRAAEPAAGFP